MEDVYTVTIRMKPDEKPGSSYTRTHMQNPNVIEINVVPDSSVGASMVETLAHELGHVVGQIARTPAYVRDPRHVFAARGEAGVIEAMQQMGITPPHAKAAIIAAEKEAWDIGRMMLPTLSENAERTALKSYDQIG